MKMTKSKMFAGVRAAAQSDEFDWNESGEQYIWSRGSSKIPGMANTVLGSLTPEGSRLSEIHDLSKIAQDAPSSARVSGIPPEVESQMLAEFSGRYYRAWLDEQIPALGGRTPRHAASLKT